MTSKKFNNSAIIMLKLLQLLYEDDATYENVVELFQSDEYKTNNNLSVNINKYLNALKVYGFKITKVRNKFILKNKLIPLDITEKDILALSILSSIADNIPDKKVIETMKNIVKMFEARISTSYKNLLENNTQNSKYKFSNYFISQKDKIKLCEEICQENFLVDIKYIQEDEIITIKCNPAETIYTSNNAYLVANNISGNKRVEIPIKSIIEIKKSPQKAKENKISSNTVVYKLKNRLSKTYKLKENEHSNGYDENGNLVVVCSGEDQEKLLQRLFRYSFDCEIISPTALRKEMKKRILETLNHYKEEGDKS